jgi:hypothetical protein
MGTIDARNNLCSGQGKSYQTGFEKAETRSADEALQQGGRIANLMDFGADPRGKCIFRLIPLGYLSIKRKQF